MTRKELNDLLRYEQSGYQKALGCSMMKARLLGEPLYHIWKWQKASRLCDYYAASKTGPLASLMAACLRRIANRRARRVGFDISTLHIGRGLLIYHPGATVINGGCRIGTDFHLHGNNCLGNLGEGRLECPTIGNGVTLGVGAKVLGGITLDDQTVVGAGAVVLHSFGPNSRVGGIPARELPTKKS